MGVKICNIYNESEIITLNSLNYENKRKKTNRGLIN